METHAMHASLVVKHVLLPRKAQSAELARLHFSRSQVLELQMTFVLVVQEIAMRVLQQMFAPCAQVLINCLRHVVHAVMGVRHAALKAPVRLAKMGFI
jgi:hypothetical protein